MNSYPGQSGSTWVSDFETTTDENDCRVWAWGICSIYDIENVEIGNDIEGFISWCSAGDSAVYFHNLAFDGSFILDYILRDGFVHVDSKPRSGEFSTLISDTGKFYSITVRWYNGNVTHFRDSIKKLPMSVANVAKAFALEEAKGEIDYHAYRPVGHVLTDEEKDYLIADVQIIARALRVQLEQGMTKLTVGSDSLNEFKTMMGKRDFSRLFPLLPLEADAEIRSAYRGGWTYADSRRRGRVVGKGRAYDVNSLYPWVMRTAVLPYGEPVYEPGPPTPTESRPLYVVSVTLMARLKRNRLPCIQIKKSPFFVGTEYQKNIAEPTTVFCTNVDLELWSEHYDIDILSYNGAWMFHGAVGLFNDYVDKWSKIKENETGGLRAIAKLHLNSLYGKFATNPNVTPKVPVLEDNRVKLVLGSDDERPPVYTAMGVFITSYARDKTIRAAQQHYDSFLYADTDSLHLLCEDDPSTLDIDPNRLGAWKHEYTFKHALFARAKAYTVQLESDSYVTHIAGLPDTVAKQVRFDDYQNGKTFSGKLQPKRVPGGIVLDDVGFTLQKLM